MTEEAALKKNAEISQIARTKCEEIANIISENEAGQWLSKKARGKQPKKYCRNAVVKIGGDNPCKRCVCIK